MDLTVVIKSLKEKLCEMEAEFDNPESPLYDDGAQFDRMENLRFLIEKLEANS